MKYLTLCLLTAKATIPEEVTIYQSTGKVGKEATSYPMVASDNFASCMCDITAGGCDEGCCCDPDCSEK